MDIKFNYSGGALYDKVNRDFKDLDNRELQEAIELAKESELKYQDIRIKKADGSKKVLKAVSFRNARDNDELVTVRLTKKNIDKLKAKFGEENFIKMDNGTTRLTKEAEEFVSTWFEDIRYNRGFDRRGADFELQYDYLDNKLDGDISSVDVEMTENYLSLGKMKFLTQDLHEDMLDKLTQEQKDEIRDEFERAKVMIEYLKKYIKIFESDKGRNLTDELNTTLRIDEDFNGQIDIDENFKRDSKNPTTAREFFTNLAKDFNEKYIDKDFIAEDFEKDKDIDFMSFTDMEEFYLKIKAMEAENDKANFDEDSDDSYIDKMFENYDEIKGEIVANVSKGKTALKGDWQLALDLLYDNKLLEPEPKKVEDEKSKKAKELQDKVENSINASLKSMGVSYLDGKKMLEGIVSTYDKLYKESDKKNFVNKLFDDFTNVEHYELDSSYNTDYSGYLGAKEFLQEIIEYANKRDYSDSYIGSNEFKKEFFDFIDPKKNLMGYAIDIQKNTPYGFARNLVRAKEQPDYTWKVKFENVKNEIEKSIENEPDNFFGKVAKKQKEREIELLNNLLKDLNR